jgi:hypothetical protein
MLSNAMSTFVLNIILGVDFLIYINIIFKFAQLQNLDYYWERI